MVGDVSARGYNHLRRAQAREDGAVVVLGRRAARGSGLVKLGLERDDVPVEVLERELGHLELGVEVERDREAEHALQLAHDRREPLRLLAQRVDHRHQAHGLARAVPRQHDARGAARQVVAQLQAHRRMSEVARRGGRRGRDERRDER